jgi:trehalose 6-phosphate phosphatase
MQAAAVLDASFDRTRSELAAFAKTRPGLLLEDKGATLGLHYRRSPALAGAVERAVHEAAARLGTAYEVQPGKMVYEIRPRHCDKGRAIAAFAAEAPFAARLPVFIGDDVTDEHGFGIVNRMGGHSIKVGAGATAAQWRLRDTAGVVKWLRRYMCSQGYTDVG